MDSASLKRYSSSQSRACQHCGDVFNLKGIGAHEKACARRIAIQRSDKEYEESLEKKGGKKKGMRITYIIIILILTLCFEARHARYATQLPMTFLKYQNQVSDTCTFILYYFYSSLQAPRPAPPSAFNNNDGYSSNSGDGANGGGSGNENRTPARKHLSYFVIYKIFSFVTSIVFKPISSG